MSANPWPPPPLPPVVRLSTYPARGEYLPGGRQGMCMVMAWHKSRLGVVQVSRYPSCGRKTHHAGSGLVYGMEASHHAPRTTHSMTLYMEN